MLTLGIDDAGRGPLIGPMTLAGALLDEAGEKFLKKNNVRDSKTVSPPVRVEMAGMIEETALAFYVVVASPKMIDDSIEQGINLNTLEAMKIAEIINNINDGKFRKEKIKVVVDCPSVNTVAWGRKLEEFVKHKDNLKIVCEHKADTNHISAAAGSILAKVRREEEVGKLKKKYGEIGSGYPADPYTKKFLQEQGEKLRDSGIFRKSWATWKKVFPDDGIYAAAKGQRSLGDY